MRTVAFMVGLWVGAAIVGYVASLCGEILVEEFGVGPRRVLWAAGVFFLASELVRPSATKAVWSSNWQVPREWISLGIPLFEFVFGVALGLGFVTVVPYAGFYVLIAGTVALGDPAWGLAVMTVFALFRVLPLLLVKLGFSRVRSLPECGVRNSLQALTHLTGSLWMRGLRTAAALWVVLVAFW